MGLSAGSLTVRAVLQNKTVTTTAGLTSETWSDVDVVWLASVGHSDREFWNAAQVKDDMTHMFKCRYDSRISAKSRFKYDDNGTTRTFNVIGVDNVGLRNREMSIVCKESGS